MSDTQAPAQHLAGSGPDGKPLPPKSNSNSNSNTDSNSTGMGSIPPPKTGDVVVNIPPETGPRPLGPPLKPSSATDTVLLLQTFQTALGIPTSFSDVTYAELTAAMEVDASKSNPPHSSHSTAGDEKHTSTKITALTSGTHKHHWQFARPSTANTGIYTAIRHAEQRAKLAFRFYNAVLTLFLLLQILFGATLTAMGATQSPHIAITVVSAIATVVAGTLALLKGQGLPNRCRQDWAGWKAVRDYVEEREAEIAAGMWTGVAVEGSGVGEYGDLRMGGGLEAVWREVRVIEGMYKAVGRTVDGNHPDSYVTIPSPAAGDKK